MPRRRDPRTVHRDTITGLPVLAPEATRRSRLPAAVEAILKAGSREQLTAIAGILVLLVTGTTFAVTHAGPHPASTVRNAVLQGQRAAVTAAPSGTPLPSGYGPTLSDAPTAVVTSPPADITGEFCQQSYIFIPNISQWSVPPGCYATIYTPNPANFPYRPGFGYCNWWVREQHLNHPDITEGNFPRSSTPVAGEAVWLDPGVQGASSEGHWAQLVAISPGGYWLLISEMNFSWRGGGFGEVDYRYIHTGPGILFVEA